MAQDGELRRYKQAVEDAMQQLDWAIGYLQGIGKKQVSTALSKNRSYIKQQLLEEPDEPLPSSSTDE